MLPEIVFRRPRLALLALGESLLATGALGWGLGLVGPANAGKVMAWIGIAIYGAWALGAPLGVAIYHGWHFTGIAMAIIVVANSWRILTGRAQEDELVQTRESEEVDQHGAPSGER